MKSDIGHPDIVLLVHSDHVGQEEKTLAPGIDGVPTRVDRQNGCLRNWYASVQTIRVIPEKKGFIRNSYVDESGWLTS